MLSEARQHGQLLAELPVAYRPTSVDQAHAIQVDTAACLHDTIAGWKVATAPDGQLVRGGLLRSRLYTSGASLPAALVPLLGVEVEVGFRVERDLPSRVAEYTYAEVAAAVTAFPAIEVVDSRFPDYPNAPFLDRVADFMSNGAYIQGAARLDWRDFDLAGLDAELNIDGQTIVRNIGGHATKDPLLPAVALVNDLRAADGVKAGQVITTGTYTGLKFAKPGQTVKAIFHGFGLAQVHFEGPQ
jgi:2-keto-4-pentenoate hydratase